MHALTILWSMTSAASLMLGLMHVVLWLKGRETIVYLLSAAMAFSASAEAMIELAQMQSQSVSAYAALLQWQNLSVYFLLLSMVWVVYLMFGTARRWLAIVISLAWTIAIIVNFSSPFSLVFSDIEGLRQNTVFGNETFVQAYGPTNPWKLLADVTSLVILIYFIDAAARAWKKGSRRRAVVVGGGTSVFILFGGIHAALVDAAIIETPYMISFAFLAVIMALSYELVDDAVQKSRYARLVSAEEERWATLMENIRLAVIGLDLKGRITYANPFLSSLLDFPSGELVGRLVTEVIHPDEIDEFSARLSRLRETGPRDHTEWTLVDRVGGEHCLAWSSVPQKAADGQIIGALSVGADITEQRKVEDALKRSQREMERVSRANLLGELASALAHELNQPLAAILSNAQAARRFLSQQQPDLQELQEILEDIVRDDKRAGEVIHRLRAMLREGETRREWVALNPVIEEAVGLVRGELDTHHTSVESRLAEELPRVRIGVVEIQQVVINLILNADQAMNNVPGPRRVTVTSRSLDHAAEVAVSDRGRGVSTPDLERMFEPFFTSRPQGIGMGLAISRRIVEAHGGHIRAENLPDGGARVSFTLPVASEGDE